MRNLIHAPRFVQKNAHTCRTARWPAFARAPRAVIFVILFVCSLGLVLRYAVEMAGVPHLPLPHGSDSSWRQIVDQKLRDDLAKIPAAWLLDDHVVQDAKSRPKIAGDFIESLLDTETLQITNMDVPELIQKMKAAELTAVQVVTAFSKRAAYAHQMVSTVCFACQSFRALTDEACLEERHTVGDWIRLRVGARPRTGRVLHNPRQVDRTPSWNTNDHERPIPHQGNGDDDGLCGVDWYFRRPSRNREGKTIRERACSRTSTAGRCSTWEGMQPSHH